MKYSGWVFHNVTNRFSVKLAEGGDDNALKSVIASHFLNVVADAERV